MSDPVAVNSEGIIAFSPDEGHEVKEYQEV
jgi:hypothetical protein